MTFRLVDSFFERAARREVAEKHGSAAFTENGDTCPKSEAGEPT